VVPKDFVTACDLRIFVDEAAEAVPSENAHIRHGCGWTGTPGGRVLVHCPVRPVAVVVIRALAEDQPQVPFAGDQHPVQALAPGTIPVLQNSCYTRRRTEHGTGTPP
jgi:hypothetical protein